MLAEHRGGRSSRSRWLIAVLGPTVLASTMIAQAAPTDETWSGLSERADEILARFDRPDHPGATVAVISSGEVIFARGYGLANLEEETPCNEWTNYRLASVTKQFTAMAILMLRERGLLNLDDPISEFFPDFPEIGERITVRHLLTHTSGLVAYEDIMPEDLTEQLKDRDVLDRVSTQHGTYFTPGTEYRYSNTGYALLALIVEEISGSDFATFLRENIFEPLGMENTVAYEEGNSTVPNRAFGYSESEDGVEFADQSLTSAVLGDGGIYTSVMDYAKWDATLYGEVLVSRESLQEAFTPHELPGGDSTGYGFGWRVEERDGVGVVYHNGTTCGFSTGVRRVPERRLTVVILTNLAQGKAGDAADDLLDWLLARSDP